MTEALKGSSSVPAKTQEPVAHVDDLDLDLVALDEPVLGSPHGEEGREQSADVLAAQDDGVLGRDTEAKLDVIDDLSEGMQPATEETGDTIARLTESYIHDGMDPVAAQAQAEKNIRTAGLEVDDAITQFEADTGFDVTGQLENLDSPEALEGAVQQLKEMPADELQGKVASLRGADEGLSRDARAKAATAKQLAL